MQYVMLNLLNLILPLVLFNFIQNQSVGLFFSFSSPLLSGLFYIKARYDSPICLCGFHFEPFQ